MSTTHLLTDCRILVVDDDEANVELLTSLLEDEGYHRVTSSRDPQRAVALFQSFAPDLVLLDLHMPHLNGFEVMERLAEMKAADDFLPILVLTADVNPESRLRALGQGATDFLTKPLDAMEVALRIRNLLTTRVLHRQQQDARQRAEAQERRAEFLSDASRVLGASLDVQTTLALLPRLAVPRLADYCVLEVDDGADGRQRVGVAHVRSDSEALLTERAPLWGGALPHGHPAVEALESGQSMLLHEVEPGQLSAEADDVEREALQWLNPRSLIMVPLVVSGRVTGCFTLALSESGRCFGADDLALAEELMRRAAGAQDNARLYDEAVRATRARDRVLAVVAHDLRNPLSTIGMAADLLLEEVAEPQRQHLERVRRATGRMNELIQNLLDVSRLDRGQPALDRCPERVPELVAEAASMLGPLAAARDIVLETELEEGLPLAMADAKRLLQVISNLVGNAVKFTDSGGRILIRCAAGSDEVRFAVADTGRGIPADQLPHIFGTFWQASPDDQRGIGLGLSIAQGIVEGHGGRIWVESEPGLGTTFHFTIPTVPDPAVARAPIEAVTQAV
ncbi:MAG TPA: ATP-binding protein [Longimicrobiales bacterium]|nr:ATP-binding protein [Longimicrobiales bacterium]